MLRHVVLGLFACTVAVIALLAGMAAFSILGWSTDPHGYGMIAGIVVATALSPVALILWVLYRSMRPR